MAMMASMQPAPEMYPPRDRATNIDLIRALLHASDESAFDAAMADLGNSLHPSLLAELDWRERSMPPEQRQQASEFADVVFLASLAQIVSARRSEFVAAPEELEAEIHGHRRFYEYLLEQRPDVLDALDRDFNDMVRAQLAEPSRAEEVLRARRSKIRAELAPLAESVEDPEQLRMVINAMAYNAVALALDHVSARLDTKRFLARIGDSMPTILPEDIRDKADINESVDRIYGLADEAARCAAFDLTAAFAAMADVLGTVEVTSLGGCSGEQVYGAGPCGRCSMFFAGTVISIVDPTCPYLTERDDGSIDLGLFNVTSCPFCGYEARVDTVCLFHSPKRAQVIYNVPALGQFTPSEAIEAHRDTVEDLRRRYRNRLSAEEAECFDRAAEEITHSMPDFLLTVQMGTTAEEDHAYLLIGTADGHGLIADPAKKAQIVLTPDEYLERSAQSPAAGDELFDGGLDMTEVLNEAISAYESEDYGRATEILEWLHDRQPDDARVRRNLAAVYLASGRKSAATVLLSGGA